MGRRILASFILLLLGGTAGWWLNSLYRLPSKSNLISQINKFVSGEIKPRPLDKYTIENLSETEVPAVEIKIEENLKENKTITSYLFSMLFDPSLSGSQKKKVTGLINIPNAKGPYPLVIMLRGFVDQKEYRTGDGTRRAGEYFAKNGFITLAPDFLGYGGSDKEAENIFESRFQTYTTTLTLLKSLSTIEQWDNGTIFLWGHSNGGQIALTILEITQKNYPTTLWAPVSKPFPYSILYYTDESEDLGKFLRRQLAKFEEVYDADKYSINKYLDRIKAPVQIHQGTSDDSVPPDWSKSLSKVLKGLGIKLKLFLYQGADHNMTPHWSKAIERDLIFFKSQVTSID